MPLRAEAREIPLLKTIEQFNAVFSPEQNSGKKKACFVLGAGPSLHFQNLEPLKDFYTIGVNSGVLSTIKCGFETDYFLSDDHDCKNWNYFSETLVNSKHTQVLLYEGKLGQWYEWFSDRSFLFKHRQGYHVTDYYSHSEYSHHLLQTRTSVSSAVHFAHICGMSPIVLLGCDMCYCGNKRFFWEYPDEAKPRRTDSQPPLRFRPKRYGRGRMPTDSDLQSICRYWQQLGVKLLEKIEVYNCSGGILDMFPRMELDDFLAVNQDKIK